MINVLITGVGGGGVGEQLTKAIRLSDNQYKIIGTDVTPISKGFKEVDFAYVVPRANADNYIEVILEICKKHNIKAFFSGYEAELQILASNKKIFEKEGIYVFVNKKELLDICLDKTKTVDFLAENGFYFPKSQTVNTLQDIEKINYFPIVLKPSTGGGGSMNVMIAQNKSELELFSVFLLKIYSSFIAQEYVGTPEHEYTVGLLFDKDSNYINSIALKRQINAGLSCRLRIPNNTSNVSLGKNLVISSGISQGEFGHYPIVTEQCTEIAKKIKAIYSINLQCRLVEDKVYLFEINPRFSGTTSLRAMVGYNEPDLLIRKEILGETITPNFKYKYAHIVRGLKEEVFFTKV
jgi:carbamoyl-phosphate synthase large subunit